LRNLRVSLSNLTKAVVLGALLALAVHAGAAAAQPGLLVGVTDDSLRWATDARAEQAALQRLGAGAVRLTERWAPGEARISAAEAASLAKGLANARGLRVVLSVYGAAQAAPQTDAARGQYCSYVRSIAQRFPQIRDVVVWNEVNSSRFWAPQYDASRNPVAPAQYEALLAACYGRLQTARPGMNVIATLAPRGNDDPQAKGVVGIMPGAYVRAMGGAYRASGRPVKIFDTFALNAYGLTDAEKPWRTHAHAADMSEGDYPRLISALSDAFVGTGQPLPGAGGVSVWYLEDGFQTRVPAAKRTAYTGRENDRHALSVREQAAQLSAAIQLAYCQPGVGAFFNFELADETGLAGWQSGLLWADGSAKASFAAVAAVVARVQAGKVDCSGVPGGSLAQ
jgi:hypothetical protein